MQLFGNNFDKALTNKPIAVIMTPDGYQSDYEMFHIAGKYFYVKFNKASGGVFEIDQSKRVLWRGDFVGFSFVKTKFYYDARNQNPLDLTVLKSLERFARTNELPRIRRKDKRHGDRLHRKMHQYATQHSKKIKDLTNEEKESIRNDLQIEENADLAPVEATLSQLEDQADPEEKRKLLQTAVTTSQISLSMGEMIFEKMRAGRTAQQILEQLRDDKRIEIEEPLDVDASAYLDDYKSLEPEYTYNFIEALFNMKKEFAKLKSRKITGGFQMGLILTILVIGLIASMFAEPIITNITELFQNPPDLGLGGISVPSGGEMGGGPLGFIYGIKYAFMSLFT